MEREPQADWKLVQVAVESTLVVGILAAAAAVVVVDTGDGGPAAVPVEQELEDRKERNREWVFVKAAAAASSAGVGVGVVPYQGQVPLRAKRGDRVLGEARLEQLWVMIY